MNLKIDMKNLKLNRAVLMLRDKSVEIFAHQCLQLSSENVGEVIDLTQNFSLNTT